jgi:GT2 family glycosyltransferase
MSDSIGIVVIGRNEGERLRTCLTSVAGKGRPVVYVDSGSADDSPALARGLGVEVIELDPATPFTAARGRNAGLERLLELQPDTEFVQFVDGDCELAPGWIESAATALRNDPTAGTVFGRLRERRPEASVYNRLCNVEWNAAPVGEVQACGGISLMRAVALKQIGGYGTSLVAGEDDEVCLRLRRCAWRIVRIAADMGWHDAAMTRFKQWWTRAVRCGWAYAQGAALHGRSADRHYVHERRRAVIWAAVLPLMVGLFAWPTGGWSLLGLLLYPVSAARVYRPLRRRGFAAFDSAAYAVACTLSKWAHLVGIVKYQLHRGPFRLIEYK